MSSYIIKSKNIDLENKNLKKMSIGKFYSSDRFYTLLNEYIDENLKRKSKFMGWVIRILFKSSNFKHDPNIANGQPLSVKIFDFICIFSLIMFSLLMLSTIGLLITIVIGFLGKSGVDKEIFDKLIKSAISVGVPAIIFGIPAIFWLIIFFSIRRKNKPLTLQAYVEKKISLCLSLRFLIKKSMNKKKNPKEVFLMEGFEGQGASNIKWLNVQLINLVCSIFNDFNYVFRFETLTDDEFNELKMIVKHDFKMLELINSQDIQWNEWEGKENKGLLKEIKDKTHNIRTKHDKK